MTTTQLECEMQTHVCLGPKFAPIYHEEVNFFLLVFKGFKLHAGSRIVTF